MQMLLNLSGVPFESWPEDMQTMSSEKWGRVFDEDALSCRSGSLTGDEEKLRDAMTEVVTLLGYSAEKSAVLWNHKTLPEGHKLLKKWLEDSGIQSILWNQLSEAGFENKTADDFEIDDAGT